MRTRRQNVFRQQAFSRPHLNEGEESGVTEYPIHLFGLCGQRLPKKRMHIRTRVKITPLSDPLMG